MASVRDYRDLKVWQESLALAERVYALTKTFPNDERFGLMSQLRRASISVPSCIAEGNARGSTRDYLRFLSMAAGSLAEMETQLVLASRLGYVPEPDGQMVQEHVRMVQRLLHGTRRALGNRDAHAASPIPVPGSRSSP